MDTADRRCHRSAAHGPLVAAANRLAAPRKHAFRTTGHPRSSRSSGRRLETWRMGGFSPIC